MPDLMTPLAAAMLLPLFLHFGLVGLLYAVLTWARVVTVRRGEARTEDFARADGDARMSARIQRNLANQFEAPVFAWVGALVLILTGHVSPPDIAAAWLFLSGRLLHSLVQCTGDDVVLRGRVFTINFVGVIWLMGHAMLAILGGP